MERRDLEQRGGEARAEIGEARERIWRLYMAASAHGFETREISVYQLLAARQGAQHGLPLERRAPALPAA